MWSFIGWVSISSMPGVTPPAFEYLRYVAIKSVYTQTEYALYALSYFYAVKKMISSKKKKKFFEVVKFIFYLYVKLVHYTF